MKLHLIFYFSLFVITQVYGQDVEKKTKSQGISFVGSGFGYSSTKKSILRIGVNYERYFDNWSFGLGGFTEMDSSGEEYGPQVAIKYFFCDQSSNGIYLLGYAAYHMKNDSDESSLAPSVSALWQWSFGKKNKNFFALGYGVDLKNNNSILPIDFGFNF